MKPTDITPRQREIDPERKAKRLAELRAACGKGSKAEAVPPPDTIRADRAARLEQIRANVKGVR